MPSNPPSPAEDDCFSASALALLLAFAATGNFRLTKPVSRFKSCKPGKPALRRETPQPPSVHTSLPSPGYSAQGRRGYQPAPAPPAPSPLRMGCWSEQPSARGADLARSSPLRIGAVPCHDREGLRGKGTGFVTRLSSCRLPPPSR